MARFKDFDAAESERKGEPITFTLGGQEWTAAHVNAPTFLAFAREAAEPGLSQYAAFTNYISAILKADQRESFTKMLEEKDIQLLTLMDLGKWIVEQATGNPLDDASPSPIPQSNTGKPRVVYSRSPRQESITDTAPSATG